jgi:hypothetical protein
MLSLVPLDTPIGKGDILAGGRPVFLHIGSIAATISAVLLVFFGTEMALGVCGFSSFPIHNDKVN